MIADPKVKELLEKIFDSLHKKSWSKGGLSGYEKARIDFVFHMMDWQEDLEQLRGLFLNPDKETVTSACLKNIEFLIHVIPHLDTAGVLLLGKVNNPFLSKETKEKKKRAKRAASVL